MNSLMRAVGALCVAFVGAVCAGCQVAPPAPAPSSSNAPASATPAATATPAAPAAENNAAQNEPVTLPVLDAFFADESFAADLQTRLQLTAEQLARLRNVARTETAALHESDQTDAAQSRSTSAAAARATEQINAVIGPDKTQQLFALVRARWASGGPASGESAPAVSAQPNAVPTDTRIVVNAPAYRMDVYEQGRLIKTYKVGIGYPEFPLPTGLRKAATIIFNPTWTPPDEPWVGGRNSSVRAGQKVPAGSRLNPLGPIKIPIGLPSLIHGGKSPARLGSFASHGCVGLTSAQVQDFAQVLAQAGGTQLDAADVAAYAKNKTTTKSVSLAQAVPVELRYETIVVEDGKLHIYRDVYDRGTNTEENLRRVLQVYGVALTDLSAAERTQVTAALAAMAHDAAGRPVAGGDTAHDSSGESKQQPQAAASGHVTRSIKGKKEIVIELAALHDQGYPAPVNFDTGTGTPPKPPKPKPTPRTEGSAEARTPRTR